MSKLDMSDKRLQKLELNKKNVLELFYNCRKTDKTGAVVNANFYDKSSSRKAPIAQFDFAIVNSHSALIRYLIGQLQAIHQNKTKFTTGAGIINYKDEKWTDDNMALFSLYYLATATGVIQKFIDGEKYAYTDLKALPFPVKPTYPPSDPRFNIKDAKYALQELGIDIEEPTHVD